MRPAEDRPPMLNLYGTVAKRYAQIRRERQSDPAYHAYQESVARDQQKSVAASVEKLKAREASGKGRAVVLPAIVASAPLDPAPRRKAVAS